MHRRHFLRGTAAALAAPSLLLDARLAAAAHVPRTAAVPLPIRLAQNENPLGMPEGARRAVIDALKDGNRYPRLGPDVITAIANRNGIAVDNVTLGNGSTEILRCGVELVTARGRAKVVTPHPTYEDMQRYSAPYDAELVRVPLLASGEHDLAAMRAATEGARENVLVFICNPNNPTGGVTDSNRVAEWIAAAPETHTFLIDEAYFEFVDDPRYRTLVPLALSRPNVLVSRTFSKIYGMAGLRLGYAVAHADMIRRIRPFMAGTNINHLAHIAALAAIDDDDYVRRSVAENARARAVVTRTLDQLGLEWLPSQTNFVMHRINGDLTEYIARMREAQIWVGRAFPPLTTYNRVSLGTAEEMEVWAQTLRSFRSRGWV
ncbi:MAG TPA: histidinol-phosphate transaminase [Longimicrobiales bacterium]|nr:histidinol-phosphate transaminase [Longimicrobiales bacterium]